MKPKKWREFKSKKKKLNQQQKKKLLKKQKPTKLCTAQTQTSDKN